MLKIIFRNSGGVLDTRTASNEDEAATVAAEMIREAGSLHAGDSIEIVDSD